jgi:hypothetical protein
MKSALVGLLACGMALWAGNQQPVLEPAEFNVNSRYTVESVEVPRDVESRISRSLRQDIQRIVGNRLNAAALNDLGRRLRDELKVRSVTPKLVRGTSPDHVKVVIEVGRRKNEFDLSVPKFLYHSSEGWSAAVEASTITGDSRFSAGLVSDGDELPERFAGIRTRYEHRKVGTDRVRLALAFDSYHQQWNPATMGALAAADGLPGIYRTRQNFEPVATIVLTGPLTLSVGAGFQRFQTQFPLARTDFANAAITTLRYEKRMEGSDTDQQHLEAAYSLRAATRALNSDFVYARHRAHLRYSVTRGRHSVTDEFVSGLITGRAPLFERYILGTSSMLRGWNKYELDPLGGSRVVHNSLDYRYGPVEVFYDTGAIWDQGQEAIARHSVGVGLRKSSFLVAMAFPIKEGRVIPVFMVGMNY